MRGTHYVKLRCLDVQPIQDGRRDRVDMMELGRAQCVTEPGSMKEL
jgi:hypothetical protein